MTLMNNLLPQPEQDARSKKINLRFKLGLIAYVLIFAGIILFNLPASGTNNILCEMQHSLFGSCNTRLNAVIMIAALYAPILIAQAIVWKVTGVRIEYRKGRSFP